MSFLLDPNRQATAAEGKRQGKAPIGLYTLSGNPCYPRPMSLLSWLPALRERLETACTTNGVPLGVAVGWIQVESGGRVGEMTSLGERGLFQLIPDEIEDLGLDAAKLSTDVDYSILGGMNLIKRCQKYLRSYAVNVDLGGELYWRLVKFVHSIGPGAARTIIRDASKASVLTTWDAFEAYCTQHDADYLSRLRHSPVKWCGLVDRVFLIGAPYGVESGIPADGIIR